MGDTHLFGLETQSQACLDIRPLYLKQRSYTVHRMNQKACLIILYRRNNQMSSEDHKKVAKLKKKIL